MNDTHDDYLNFLRYPLEVGNLVQFLPSDDYDNPLYGYSYNTQTFIGIIVSESSQSVNLGVECFDVQWLDTDHIDIVNGDELVLAAKPIKV